MTDLTTTITVHTFECGTEKEAALKPLEEAAEVYGAWEIVRVDESNGLDSSDSRRWLADEIADTVTACVNLAHRYGLDLQAAIDRVEERNRERGRYADARHRP